MRVNQTGSNQVQEANTHRTGKAGDAKNARDSKRSDSVSDTSTSVKADISSRGKEIAHANAVAQAAPDSREEKIAELKRRIADGSYKVDTKAVADRLVDEHLATADLG
jgi:negative regulator of flagellin synthesis FlgM